MRRIVTRALILLTAVVSISLAADNANGTWKANLAKSKYTPAPMPLKSYTIVREAAPGGVKVTVTGERTDGSPVKGSYTAKYDGSSTPVTGSGVPYDSIAVKQVDANTTTAEAKHSSTKYRASFKSVISPDGKTMTITGKGADSTGAPMNLLLVLDKQ
jgi:hypothetical protein